MRGQRFQANEAITWERMHQLRRLDLAPFELAFFLDHPVTLEGDVCFGIHKVARFETDCAVVFVDGEFVMVESADAVYVSVGERN